MAFSSRTRQNACQHRKWLLTVICPRGRSSTCMPRTLSEAARYSRHRYKTRGADRGLVSFAVLTLLHHSDVNDRTSVVSRGRATYAIRFNQGKTTRSTILDHE